MTNARDPEALLAAYLAEGMDVLPDRVADAVLDEAHRTRQRIVIGPWRTPLMDAPFKLAMAAAAVVAVAVVGINLVPGGGGPGGPVPASPTPVITPPPSPRATATPTVDRMKVGGTAQELTLELPEGWTNEGYAANPGAGLPGEGFFVSVPANTFADPCEETEPGRLIEPTLDAITAAIRQIPDVTASEPSQVEVAGYDATYIELAGPETLPCAQYNLWQDSPGNFWWMYKGNEIVRVHILDVDGEPVVISARSGPDATDEDKAALMDVLDTIVFDEVP